MADDEAPRAVTDTTVETPPAIAPAPTTETAERPTPSNGTAVPQARPARSNRPGLIIAPIDRHRHRVDAALSALGTAQKGIGLFNKQLAFLDPLIDALAGLEAFSKAADANDLAGMQAQLTTVGAAVQKSIDLSQGASLPPGLTTGLNNFQKMVNDLKGLVSAAQAHNVAAVDKYVAAVDADGKALEAIDENAIQQAETALIKPLSDSYDRDMKTAAGG